MVQTCYICKWRADKLPRRSFHKFPYDEAEKQKWLDIIGKGDVSLGKRTSICSIHFDQTCFRYGLVNGRELLRQGSLPTIQLSRPPEVDPYEELYNMHQVDVDIKIESHSPDDAWVEGIGANVQADSHVPAPDQGALDSIHQKMKTEKDEAFDNSSCKSIIIEVPHTSTTKTKSNAKNKQNSGKIIKMDVSKRKEFLKKQTLIRMLVERLRRDHVKLKNYIQSLEEKQKTCRKRKRRNLEENSN
ncbi:THAP domain-containing protein 1-like [Maniola hyperantus]|uniref:THAP domain-containing protein 1-like n=1 Tax=Aphantopus hyperantus TaxID=2795564 RepID=UPI001569391C|nr:THAP domain-containing protein 1-like [Maniola hyperantus]